MAESGGCGNTRSGDADATKRASFLESIAGSYRIAGQEFTDCHRPFSLGLQPANFDRSARLPGRPAVCPTSGSAWSGVRRRLMTRRPATSSTINRRERPEPEPAPPSLSSSHHEGRVGQRPGLKRSHLAVDLPRRAIPIDPSVFLFESGCAAGLRRSPARSAERCRRAS